MSRRRTRPLSGPAAATLLLALFAALAQTSVESAFTAAAGSAANTVEAANRFRPQNTDAPAIGGTAAVGAALTASTGTWLRDPTDHAYRWQRCTSDGATCADIDGATSPTRTVTDGDQGHRLRVSVVATNAGGSRTATSAVTELITEPVVASDVYAQEVIADRPWGFWRLHDAAGSVLQDASGADRDAATTLVAGAFDRPGLFPTSSSLRFSGLAGGFAELPGDAVGGRGATATAELWFKTTDGGVLLSQQSHPYGQTPARYVPSLYVGDDGRLRGQFWNGAGAPITSTATVDDGRWHHAVLSAGADGQTLYLDGAAVGTAAAITSHLDMRHTYVGAGHTSGWPALAGGWSGFAGQIDEVSLYDDALAADRVSARSAAGALAPANDVAPSVTGTNEVGAVLAADTGTWSGYPAPAYAYAWERCAADGSACSPIDGVTGPGYRLTTADEGSAVRVAVTATNADGAATATSPAGAVVSAAPPDPYRDAVLADGPESFHRLDAAADAAGDENRGSSSIPAAVVGSVGFGAAGALASGNAAVTLAGDGHLRGGRGPAQDGPVTIEAWVKTTGPGSGHRGIVVKQLAYGLYLYNGEAAAYGFGGGGTLHSGVGVADGRWHHLALVVDAGRHTLFVDGAERASAAWSPASWSEDLVIGSGGVTQHDQRLIGTIDEVAVYDAALTATQIAAHVTAR